MDSLREIIQESIAMAKDAGLWQRFTLREKEDLVRYFYRHFASVRKLWEIRKVPVDLTKG